MNNLYFLDKFIFLRINCCVNSFRTLACNFLAVAVDTRSSTLYTIRSVTRSHGVSNQHSFEACKLVFPVELCNGGRCVVEIIDIESRGRIQLSLRSAALRERSGPEMTINLVTLHLSNIATYTIYRCLKCHLPPTNSIIAIFNKLAKLFCCLPYKSKCMQLPVSQTFWLVPLFLPSKY